MFRVRVALCAGLCALASLIVPESTPTAAAIRPALLAAPLAFDVPQPERPADPVRFRLGTAAGPFGRSTVIGDFNTDGKPDVAVADHVGLVASHNTYRIDILLSGQIDAAVTFESAHDAVTIGALDVDQDRDLDIVVALPWSGETVGVWLNDGNGHFASAADIQRLSVGRGVERVMVKATESADRDTLESSRQRPDLGLLALRLESIDARSVASTWRDVRAGPVFDGSATTSRGPPRFSC